MFILAVINRVFGIDIKCFDNSNKIIVMRMYAVSIFALIAALAGAVQTKVFGVAFAASTIFLIGMAIKAPEVFACRAQKWSLSTVRAIFLICDIVEAAGYIAYAITGNAIALAVCYVLGSMGNSLVACIYHSTMEWCIGKDTNEHQYKTYRIGSRAYASLAAILGGFTMFVVSMFITDMQDISLALGVICALNALYTNMLVKDLIKYKSEIDAREEQKAKKNAENLKNFKSFFANDSWWDPVGFDNNNNVIYKQRTETESK